MANETILSVRGEAYGTVAPDYVDLRCTLKAIAASKGEALAQLRQSQTTIIAELGRMGGTALAVDTERAPLTWSVGSLQTYEEHDYNKSGGAGPTGRMNASAQLLVTVRELRRLGDVADALSRHEALDFGAVQWGVDRDNPAWRQVRSDAIAAALAKGADYAAALGGAVRKITHVADAGLLSPAGVVPHFASRAAPLGGHTMEGTPTLDPVPQELQAVIEAQLVADIPGLGAASPA